MNAEQLAAMSEIALLQEAAAKNQAWLARLTEVQDCWLPWAVCLLLIVWYIWFNNRKGGAQ